MSVPEKGAVNTYYINVYFRFDIGLPVGSHVCLLQIQIFCCLFRSCVTNRPTDINLQSQNVSPHISSNYEHIKYFK
jgi:hypothetical protein